MKIRVSSAKETSVIYWPYLGNVRHKKEQPPKTVPWEKNDVLTLITRYTGSIWCVGPCLDIGGVKIPSEGIWGI